MPLSKEAKYRKERDGQWIELILSLFRNLLSITSPPRGQTVSLSLCVHAQIDSSLSYYHRCIIPTSGTLGAAGAARSAIVQDELILALSENLALDVFLLLVQVRLCCTSSGHIGLLKCDYSYI
jgi:hypothetical protein